MKIRRELYIEIAFYAILLMAFSRTIIFFTADMGPYIAKAHTFIYLFIVCLYLIVILKKVRLVEYVEFLPFFIALMFYFFVNIVGICLTVNDQYEGIKYLLPLLPFYLLIISMGAKNIPKEIVFRAIYFIALVDGVVGMALLLNDIYLPVEMKGMHIHQGFGYGGRRMFGIHPNSSYIGLISFLGFVASTFVTEKKLFKIFNFSFLGLIIFLSFQRTAMLAAMIWFFGYYLFAWIPTRQHIWIKVSLTFLVPVVIGGSFFARMSGRKLIWADAINFIGSNPILGNLNREFLSNALGHKLHTHNTFLQIMADSGLVFSGLLLLGFLLFYNRNPLLFLYFIVIFVYGFFQRSFFVGLAFSDIAMITLLFAIRSNRKQHVPVELSSI